MNTLRAIARTGFFTALVAVAAAFLLSYAPCGLDDVCPKAEAR